MIIMVIVLVVIIQSLTRGFVHIMGIMLIPMFVHPAIKYFGET